jgi:hypothetical protein
MSTRPFDVVNRSGQRREAVGEQRVDRHVGHDSRPADEAGLRRDDKEGAFGGQREDEERVAEARAAGKPLAEHVRVRMAFIVSPCRGVMRASR